MDGVQWTCFGVPWTCPWCPIIGINVHGAPSSEKVYIFKSRYPLNEEFCIQIDFFIFHFTIKNRLIDTGRLYSMPVDMCIVPHPHVHGAPSSGHHGHLLDFF